MFVNKTEETIEMSPERDNILHQYTIRPVALIQFFDRELRFTVLDFFPSFERRIVVFLEDFPFGVIVVDLVVLADR